MPPNSVNLALKISFRGDSTFTLPSKFEPGSKSFSQFDEENFRCEHIDQFRSQNSDVISILDEITSKRAEVFEKAPFDTNSVIS